MTDVYNRIDRIIDRINTHQHRITNLDGKTAMSSIPEFDNDLDAILVMIDDILDDHDQRLRALEQARAQS